MIINTNRPCQFADDCLKCLVKQQCISATRMTYQKRKFILSLKNTPIYDLKTKELFKKGIIKHEEKQKGIKTIEEYGYKNFRRDLLKHKRVMLKEIKVCSPLYALHGIIDTLILHYHKNGDLDIWIDELKSNYSKKHFMQLGVYSLILSDLNARVVCEEPMKRKNKNKRKISYLFPSVIRYINMKGRIFLLYSDKEQHYMEIIAKNHFFESSGNIKMAILRKLKDFRKIMNDKAADITKVKYCIGCSKDDKSKHCGWVGLCSKYNYNPKLKQMYYGKSKLLIKTKIRNIV